MNFYDFQKWSQYRINYDLKYCDSHDFYAFSFISNSLIINENDIKHIKPVYPWKEEILKEIKSIELKDIIHNEKIKELKKKIIKIKKENYFLRKYKKKFFRRIPY